MPFYSPLRYPGGKRKLANYVQLLIGANGFDRRTYVEPYAGGAAVAIHLLLERHVPRVVINDVDPCLWAFWKSVRDDNERLCRKVAGVRINMDQWIRQKAVLQGTDPCPLDLGLATLFLNRTNRSGVLLGGVIGGKQQRGKWSMTARFNRTEIIRRIEAIGSEADRLEVRCEDASYLLAGFESKAASVFLFLDPPYYHKARRLYRDDYAKEDHAKMAGILAVTNQPWLLSYDDCGEIRKLYARFRRLAIDVSYTAGRKRRGSEVLFFSPGLRRVDGSSLVVSGARLTPDETVTRTPLLATSRQTTTARRRQVR